MNTTKIPTPILTIFLQTVVYFTHYGDKYQLYFFIIITTHRNTYAQLKYQLRFSLI